MSKQAFSDESNWKHEPHTEHYVKDKFGKGSTTRNWKKNLDPKLKSEGQEADAEKKVTEKQEATNKNPLVDN